MPGGTNQVGALRRPKNTEPAKKEGRRGELKEKIRRERDEKSSDESSHLSIDSFSQFEPMKRMCRYQKMEIALVSRHQSKKRVVVLVLRSFDLLLPVPSRTRAEASTEC